MDTILSSTAQLREQMINAVKSTGLSLSPVEIDVAFAPKNKPITNSSGQFSINFQSTEDLGIYRNYDRGPIRERHEVLIKFAILVNKDNHSESHSLQLDTEHKIMVALVPSGRIPYARITCPNRVRTTSNSKEYLISEMNFTIDYDNQL